MSRPPAAALAIDEGQREGLAASQAAPHRQVQRAKALLLAADGVANSHIAQRIGVSVGTVRAWPDRFAEDGLAKLGQVRRGRGRKSLISEEQIAEIVELTLHSKPESHTHWSCRTMADRVGVSPATVQRIWDARGLKPHRVETFKLSNDPQFEDKLIDVVGLYLDPPKKAVVLCMDEKSQIQALDRTQPSLPMTKGRAGTMTHDYKRNGTTTLFAALDVATGTVLGQCLPKHRHEEFLVFLRTIDRNVPKALQVHLILDNYHTHKHPETRHGWPSTPGSTCTSHPPRRAGSNWSSAGSANSPTRTSDAAASPSVPDLIASIEDYLRVTNANPKPLIWTASAESILEKVHRGRVALNQSTKTEAHH